MTDKQRGLTDILYALPKCNICGNKRYLISRRDDGFDAVETCDACTCETKGSVTLKIDDEDAAILATRDGVACQHTYPCYLIGYGPHQKAP